MSGAGSSHDQVAVPRWYTTIPMKYREGQAFWGRDAGLFCLGFKANGIDSKFVALGDPAAAPPDRPLILSCLAEMENPDWWRKWSLSGVLLYSWALPRYAPIAQAIKKSGAKLVIILDTDGVISPLNWFSRFIQIKHAYARERGAVFPGLMAIAQTILACFSSRYKGTLNHLQEADILALPSPLALQRYGRWLRAMNRPHLVRRLRLVHHPVATSMSYERGTSKKPMIIAVGGWNRLVKGGSMLIRVLGDVLQQEPGYSACIVGTSGEVLQEELKKLQETVRNRIILTGPLEHEQLVKLYQECQICLNTSYSESFGIACAESLCCGCSVVGHALIASMVYFCSANSGTVASTRSKANLADALLAEIAAWESGQRNPEEISSTWTARLHVDRVVRAILDLH